MKDNVNVPSDTSALFYSRKSVRFSLKRPQSGHHYKKFKRRHNAVQIMFVIWDPRHQPGRYQPNDFYIDLYKFCKSFFDVCLTVHHLYNRGPTRSNNNNLLIFKTTQHVSGNYFSIIRTPRLLFTSCGIMWRMLLEQHPSHRTHCPCRHTPDLRPTTSWGLYTTCCKS